MSNLGTFTINLGGESVTLFGEREQARKFINTIQKYSR